MLTAILTIGLMVGLFGLALGYAGIRFKVEGNSVVDQIDALLPQTQCRQCTYAGCRPYAEAIAKGEAPINQCPPGGQSTIVALAGLLKVEVLELNTAHGEHKEIPLVAIIAEQSCIGCTLCIQACPVDAILGAAKHMHTVITDECTGCELCLPPCPVDCIDMVPIKQSAVCPSQIPLVQYYRATRSKIRALTQARFKSDRSRTRFEFREKRLLLKKQLDEERRRIKREALQKKHPQKKVADTTVNPVQAALERVRAKKQALDVKPGSTTDLTTAQQKQIEQTDKRRHVTSRTRQGIVK